MQQTIAQMALVVADYDEAIEFYTKKLLFEVVEDTHITLKKRWVLIQPIGPSNFRLLLAKAEGDTQKKAIGNQSGGRVFLFLFTDDFEGFYAHLLKSEVKIVRPPKIETYGKVAVFADLYGNLWDIIQPL